MSAAAALPDTIRVLERGWLSANNIVLIDGDRATVVDSGYVSHGEQTVALLREVLAGRRLAELVNTHSHSDHIGGNALLQRTFGCSISVPAGMLPSVAAWDEDALLLTTAAQSAERFHADRALHPGDMLQMGGLAWQAIAAPGHDMDALVFHNADRRILISGDALWRDGFGILFAEVLGTGDGIGATRRTLEAIARLAVDVVIPGHGAPFVEFDDALARAFARLRAFEEDGARMARNAIRACMTFSLLDARSMRIDALAEHLDGVPLYREANARFLGLAPETLADWLVAELTRAGVARREGELLVAA
ncbi:MBL fold metallo-hydrolase [Aromatoleum evansii]|uniref:MBL fold metallo-hydrolase n=1 Tax=Aromatoleum evansii TaxID=59406 RepID=A0ABZ1AM34_AROEV|nr:MBL fold metallo-hydrolase [Aromatoleum evansii]NMG30273.1 MBL fold metallo-hydrolase [Aromatoleum evansii]WRL46919.1 MBL fold metallo-hydrolase [Aromatoleum evansii]